ncbi:MAG TPA: hypothetical protein VN829_04030, partial [Dongiaceae bacterium]|nr:hypothetical protein [Dongiaceae bacterium]
SSSAKRRTCSGSMIAWAITVLSLCRSIKGARLQRPDLRFRRPYNLHFFGLDRNAFEAGGLVRRNCTIRSGANAEVVDAEMVVKGTGQKVRRKH